MTTEHVRKSFALDFGPYRELAEQWFDEWLQAEKAEAWDEGYSEPESNCGVPCGACEMCMSGIENPYQSG